MGSEGSERRTIKVVSCWDEAIDRDAMTAADIEKYAATRDFSLLRLRATPAIFHVRRIPVSTYTRFVLEPADESARIERAFICGVTQIENLVTEAGTRYERRTGTQKMTTPHGVDHWWSEVDVESLVDEGALDVPTLHEIGGVALTRAALRRGSAPRYLRLPSSPGEWADLRSRFAAPPEPSAPPSSVEHD